MKVDFKNFPTYPEIDTETPVILDVTRELSNSIYKNAGNIVAYNLSLKIFNSTEAIEISEEEKEILTDVCQRCAAVWFLSSVIKNLE